MDLIRSRRGLSSRIAKGLGITTGAIAQWDQVPAERVPEIERIAGIPRHDLRPDLWSGDAAAAPRSGHLAVPPAALRELLHRIMFFYAPLEVWLFGSRVRGEARPDSDWDILVVVDDVTPEAVLDPDVAWRLQRGAGVAADIVCYRARDFAAEARLRNTLAYEVVAHGGRQLDVAAL